MFKFESSLAEESDLPTRFKVYCRSYSITWYNLSSHPYASVQIMLTVG